MACQFHKDHQQVAVEDVELAVMLIFCVYFGDGKKSSLCFYSEGPFCQHLWVK